MSVSRETTNHFCPKQSTINIIYLQELSTEFIRIERNIWESYIRDTTYNHGLIGNICNIGNQFRTSVKPNLNSCSNVLINFTDKFATRTVRDEARFYLWYYKMNSYELTPFYSKNKSLWHFIV